ncbi:MAG: magnesium/cobalt transporter CorA [Candidatus Cloacimonetes bacterium]|nr:magnesium/cobalt transporter CorA [Candidatus Cloacimonadota bacterium]
MGARKTHRKGASEPPAAPDATATGASSRPKLSSKAGLPPGSLVYIGLPRDHAVTLTVEIVEGGAHRVETFDSLEQLASFRPAGLAWYHLDGLHHIPWIEALGKLFEIDSLVLEDILNTRQRPKFEQLDNMLVFHLKRILSNRNGHSMEQVSLLLGKDWVLTFQERPDGLLEPLRTRLKRSDSRLRAGNADLLATAVLDVVVDSSYSVLDRIGDEVDQLELQVQQAESGHVLSRAFELRRRMYSLRRAFLPLRDALGSAMLADTPLLRRAVRPFLRDVHDHVLHASEQVESHREIVTQVVELHLSLVNLRANEIMKILTIMASLFIPLSFLAGVYGMNFQHPDGSPSIPELRWIWGYPAFWGACLFFVLSFLIYFRRKRWI